MQAARTETNVATPNELIDAPSGPACTMPASMCGEMEAYGLKPSKVTLFILKVQESNAGKRP